MYFGIVHRVCTVRSVLAITQRHRFSGPFSFRPKADESGDAMTLLEEQAQHRERMANIAARAATQRNNAIKAAAKLREAINAQSSSATFMRNIGIATISARFASRELAAKAFCITTATASAAGGTATTSSAGGHTTAASKAGHLLKQRLAQAAAGAGMGSGEAPSLAAEHPFLARAQGARGRAPAPGSTAPSGRPAAAHREARR